MQEKLLILRKNENITIKKMGEILKIAPKTYSEKERGLAEFTQDEMFELGKKFNLNIDQIFLPRGHRNGDWVTEIERSYFYASNTSGPRSNRKTIYRSNK